MKAKVVEMGEILTKQIKDDIAVKEAVKNQNVNIEAAPPQSDIDDQSVFPSESM